MGTRRFRAVAALLCAGIAGPAGAQTVETVTVGGEAKRAFGTVTGLQSGDIACYVTLKDDRGATFREMADFELCQQPGKLLNKRVALKYTLNKVQSPDCQGDPDCKKSVTVPLVVAATPVAAAAAPVAAAATRTSFCTADEQILFSCPTGQKIVSVCAPKGASAKQGYVEYRYGDAAGARPEVALPASRTLPPNAASGTSVPFAGGGGSWLTFRSGEVTSTVYTGIGNWGPKGEKREKAGLYVARAGKEVASLKCVGSYRSELGPVLFERLGIGSGGADFAFPD